MSLESTVSIAKVGTNSVRATVPEGIVAFLNLKAGDKLIWQMEVKDSQRMALVTKKVNVESVEQARHSMKMKRKRTEEDEF
jgi:antitoxin component of MazEF toxin-antitoxin module